MRVLVIGSYAESLLNFRGALLAAMLSCSHEVHVAAPDLFEGSELRRQLERRSLNVHDIGLCRTGINPLGDLYLLWSLLALMRRIKPDIVLTYTAKPVIYGILAAWFAGVKRRYALITGLGYAFTGQDSGLRRIVKGIMLGLYKLSLRRSHKAFFQNTDDQDHFRELGLLSNSIPSVVVNGSGVDLVRFHVVPLPPGAPHFLLIARLLVSKGLREYAEAAQHLKALYPDVQFSLAGWLDDNPDAISRSELESWILAGSVQYLGYLQDVRPAIAQCTVYVLPSYREGTPRTVLEAMSMCRAVITSNAPGCRETVVDGETGLLVPVKSADALIAAMERFIHEPALALRLGQRGRVLAEDKYDVNKVNVIMLSEMGM
jgi:glycosyltransferase involved in cell wall biosynthesis